MLPATRFVLQICFLWLCIALLTAAAEIKPLQDESKSFCVLPKCLYQLEDDRTIDKTCRNHNIFLGRFCYCCGGVREYVTFGSVCRRFCRKRRARQDNGQILLTTPCRPFPEVEAEDLNPHDVFPNRPTLVSIDKLDCHEERANRDEPGFTNEVTTDHELDPEAATPIPTTDKSRTAAKASNPHHYEDAVIFE